MTRQRLLKIFVPVLAILGVSAVAFAYWTTAGAGSASGSVATLNAPTNVEATGGTNLAHVSWTGSTLSTGTPAQGYYVQRYSGTSSPAAACGTDPATPGTYIGHTSGTITCTDSGVAPGTYTYKVTAVYRSWTAQSIASGSATVTNPVLDHFALTASTTTPTAGIGGALTITAKDLSNNTITSYGGDKSLTFSGAGDAADGTHPTVTDKTGVAVIFGTATTITFSNGVATTAGSANGVMRLYKAETASIVVGAGSISSTVLSVTVSPAALNGFTVATPATQTVGQSFSESIKAIDTWGNAASGWISATKCVTFSGPANSPNNTAPAYPAPGGSCSVGQSDLNFDGSGQATVSITLYKASTTTTLTVTDTTPALKTGSSSQFTVSPAAASALAFSTQPGSATAGSAFGQQPVVRTQDSFGNNSTVGLGANRTVTVSIASGTGTLQGTATLDIGTAAGNGTVTFTSLRIDTAGGKTLQAAAAAGSPTLANATSNSFTVSPAAASALAFSTQPGSATAGAAFGQQPVVKTQDSFGNDSTVGLGASRNVTVSIASGAGPLQGTAMLDIGTAAGNGTVTFTSLRIDAAGIKTLQAAAAAGSPTLANATSTSFTVSPASANRLAFTTSPAGAPTITGGIAFATQPVVTVQDQFGNTVTTDNGVVTLSITSGTGTSGAALTCTTNPLSATSGVASFGGCKIDKSGTGYTLTAARSGLTSDVSSAFNVGAGSATRLVLSASATTLTAGGTTSLTITAVDAGGNTATGYTLDATLTFGGAGTAPDSTTKPTVTSKTGTAVAFGTAETITFTNGVAQVSGSNNGVMTLYKAETASVTVSDGSINNNASPLSVTVNVGSAAKLAWTPNSTSSLGTPSPNPCYFTCTYSSGFGNQNTWTANVSITDSAGNIVSSVGAGHDVTVTKSGLGNGSITPASPATLTMPATGPATSSNFVKFTGGNGQSWTNTLTAASTGFTTTATFSK
ncbi:MAG: Mucin-22 [Solirubrobacterales bacterium]|nr:Mucin-22 [Solirubrobacterales bacterium]